MKLFIPKEIRFTNLFINFFSSITGAKQFCFCKSANNLYKLSIVTIILLSFNLNSIGQALHNIKISNSNNDNPNEPSIMIDPTSTDNIVAGSNLSYFYTSSDGGQTWSSDSLESQYGVWGDPVIIADNNGDFYYFHLSNPEDSGHWVDRIVCQKSTNKGISWTDGVGIGYDTTNEDAAQDKAWAVVDPSNNNIYLTWSEFDMYESSDSNDHSRILFSKSTDNGNTWSYPKTISIREGDCSDSDNTVEGAVPAVGPNGEIYVAWAGPNGIVFNRSTDQGETWLENEILVNSMPGGWDYSIPGLYRANGLPITKCDLSNGPNRGTIYVNWSDQRNGENNTDIWLAKSTDNGNTWSDAIKVNDDNSNKHQFLTWMDIDQTNGNLYFVFYDRREYSDNKTDVYMASSTDGGKTFKNVKISESPFVPDDQVFFGDYNNISAYDGVVRPIWTRFENGELSIWTNISNVTSFLNKANNSKLEPKDMNLYPNPTDDISYVSFMLHKPSSVTLKIIDLSGQLIETLINNAEMKYGNHIISVDTKKLNISPGMYIYTLSIDGKLKTSRKIIVK